MAAPTKTWMRLLNRLGLSDRLGRDGNPLRRRSDLIAGWLVPGAIIAFVVLAPLAALSAGSWLRADNAAIRHAQLSWHRTTAVLLQPAAGPEMPDNGANTWLVWTRARWAGLGRQRTGYVPAPARTRAGATVPIWLDRSGHVQPPPLTPGRAGDRVGLAMVMALATLAAFLAGMAGLAWLFLDRRRLASWETDWLLVGPDWSRHE